MPIYEYQCTGYNRTYEIISRTHDQKKLTCEDCEGLLKKIPSTFAPLSNTGSESKLLKKLENNKKGSEVPLGLITVIGQNSILMGTIFKKVKLDQKSLMN